MSCEVGYKRGPRNEVAAMTGHKLPSHSLHVKL